MTPTPPPRVQPSPKVTVTHQVKQENKQGGAAPTPPNRPSPKPASRLAVIKSELQKRGYKIVKVAGNKVIAKTKRQVRLELPEGSPYPYFLENAKKADTDPYKDVWYGDVDVEVEFSIVENEGSIQLVPTKTTSQDLKSMENILSEYSARGWPLKPSTIVINTKNMTAYSPGPRVLKARETVTVTRVSKLPLPDALWQERQVRTDVYRPSEQQGHYDFTGYEEYYRGRYATEQALGLGRYNRNVQYVEVGGKVYPVKLYRNEVVFASPAGFGCYFGVIEGKYAVPALATLFGAAVYGVSQKLRNKPVEKTGEIGLPLPDYAKKFGREQQDEEEYREWSPAISAKTQSVVVEKEVEIEKEVFMPRTVNINVPRVRTRLEDKSATITINADAYLPREIDITRDLYREVGIFPTEILITNKTGYRGEYRHGDVDVDEEIPINLPGAGYAYVNRYEYRTRNRFRFRTPFRFEFDFPRMNISAPRITSSRPWRKKSHHAVLGELDLFAQGILDLEGIGVAKISVGKFRRLYSSGNALWKEDLSLLSSPPPRRGRKKTRKKRKGKNKRGGKKKNRGSRRWSLL